MIAPTTPLQLKRDGNGKIWSHLRQKWLKETPEERVRQEYLCILVNEYGFALEQMAEELDLTGRGSAHARADFVLWRSIQDKRDYNSPLIIVECKADNVTIDAATYTQGELYARMSNARFFVTHNHRETKYWRVVHDKMPKTLVEIENIPHADASDREIEALLARLRIFKEDEFADLLHQCHNVIRNRDKLDPAAAFDEIAKILFVKVWVEREMRRKQQPQNLFTAAWLDSQLGDAPLELLFQQTKAAYEDDGLFAPDERINLKPATGREIVRLLEAYNLSDTSEDIKGIAFERFLGRTFRGEIGQFFTPRPIVEFMVRMIAPQEGEVVCDPASGSGGFVIRFFELVRQQIMADVDAQYHAYCAEVDARALSDDEKARLKFIKYFYELQPLLDPTLENSRLWTLANRCIYGADANERMARTSKMNMIMHGDGHGGVHHHDGFLNVNGIFEGRFDIVLTNPPFGANVEAEDVILAAEAAVDPKIRARYAALYGAEYTQAQERVQAAIGKPLACLFELPRSETGKIKTELLFIERCLALLKPGGRLGIVLPEGVFNNPSLAYVREFVEDRAYLRAVVSLPQETFYASGASVKASLLFLQKFTEEQQTHYDTLKAQALAEREAAHAPALTALAETLATPRAKASDFYPTDHAPTAAEKQAAAAAAATSNADRAARQSAARRALKDLRQQITVEARALLKQRFAYPIFMYEAAKVGLTATGEPDQNELYPNAACPPDVEKTCLELYQEFLRQPEAFGGQEKRVIGQAPFPAAFRISFSETERWDPDSFCVIDWRWPPEMMKPMGSVLTVRKEKVDRNAIPFSDLQPITIHFDGTVDLRKIADGHEYTMDLFWARPGDLVVAKIDLKNGAVGIVPDNLQKVVVTGHFVVYDIDETQVLPEYLHRVIQQPDFKEYLWRHKVGAEGRKEVKMDFFESILIPLPSVAIQSQMLSTKYRLIEEIKRLQNELHQVEVRINAMIHGSLPVT